MKENENGHITVYFSLLLLVIFSLLCTTVESARLGGIRLRCQSGAYLALESVFADYSLPVAREYGLLMLDKSYGTDNGNMYQERFMDYLSYNVAFNKGLMVRGADFCQAQPEAVFAEQERIITEKGGAALEEEILSYMEFAAPVGLVEWILEELGLLEQAEVVTAIFEKLSDLQAEAAKVDTAIQKMHRGMERIKGYTLDVAGAADSIRQALEELALLEQELWVLLECEGEDEEEKEEIAEAIARAEQEIAMVKRSIALQVDDLVQGHAQLLDYNTYVDVQRQSYDTNTAIVGEKLAAMEAVFAEGREKLDKDLRDSVEAELLHIRTYSAGVGDYYEVSDGTQDIRPNIGILEENIASLSPYSACDPGGLAEVLDACEASYACYKTENLKLNYVDEEAGGKGTDVMGLLERLLGGGILGLVAKNPAELSALEFLPDAPYEDSLAGYCYGKESFTEQLLINEYLLERMGSLHEPAKKHPLAYEVEYILAGGQTDRKNLAAVAAEMMQLRAGMNLIYLLGCEDKRMEAEQLAILLVGFTGMNGLIRVTQLLLLLAWAEAEALVDVRKLFDGERVPLAKEDSSWQLDFEGLLKLGKNSLNGRTQAVEGLTYKDYLRLLLLKEERGRRNGRTMDLIEGYVKGTYDKGFSLADCVTGLVLHTEFRAEPMFVTLPFLDYGKGIRKYTIEGSSNYRY